MSLSIDYPALVSLFEQWWDILNTGNTVSIWLAVVIGLIILGAMSRRTAKQDD